MSRPDRPARRATQPTLTPLEGRQLLSGGVAGGTLTVQSLAVPRESAAVLRSVAPAAATHAATTSITHRVVPASTASAATAAASHTITRAVTVRTGTPVVASTLGVPVHFGSTTAANFALTRRS